MIEQYMRHRRISDYEFSEDDFDELDEIRDPVDLFVRSLAGAAKSKGKRLVGEKSPSHLLAIRLIKAKIPEAKFIVVVRDCRDAVLSNLKVPWTYDNQYKHAAEWMYYMKRLNDARERFPEDVFVVRFEDYVLDYDEQMSQILSYLGIDQAERWSMQESLDAIPHWEQAWKKKAVERPDSSRVYAWKSTPNQFDSLGVSIIAKRGLESFGYDIEIISRTNRWKWMQKRAAVSCYMPEFYIPAKILWSKMHGRQFY
jgi:hypothetical protein